MNTHPHSSARFRLTTVAATALALAGCGAAPIETQPQPAAVAASSADAASSAVVAASEPRPSGEAKADLTLPPVLLPVQVVGFNAAWTDVGSPFGGTPSLVSWGSGRADLFMKNGDQLIQKTWLNNSWIPAGDHYWYIASGLASDPSAVGWQGSNIDVVFRGTANNVVHVYWDGSKWNTEDLGGIIDGQPTVSVAPDGTRMDVFARVGSSIWHRSWIGFRNGWNAWENLNLHTDSDPVAVSWGRGHVDLFYRASNGETRRYTWDGGAWTQMLAGQPWVTQPSLGGFAKGIPTVATHGVGSLEVVVQGGDDGIYRNRLGATSSFGGWTSLSACTYGTPAITVVNDMLHMVVRDKNQHRILHDYEATFPSTTAGATPMCCGLLNQNACASTACDPSVAYSGGRCVQCGYANEPACINEPQVCQPALGMDGDGYCRVCDPGTATYGGLTCRKPHVAYASRPLDGSVHVDVNIVASEDGTFAIHPHVTNHNQATGFMYAVACRIGVYEMAVTGHVGPSSLLSINGPGRDDPGARGMKGAALAADWPTILANWASVSCTLTTQSTLANTLGEIWSAITGAYMQALGFDNLTNGHICLIDCAVSDCGSECNDVHQLQSCSGEECGDYGQGLE